LIDLFVLPPPKISSIDSKSPNYNYFYNLS